MCHVGSQQRKKTVDKRFKGSNTMGKFLFFFRFRCGVVNVF